MALSYVDFEGELILYKHRKLIRSCLDILPSDYAVFHSTKPTILFFLLSGIDLLGQLDSVFDAQELHKMVNWVYDLQLAGPSIPFSKCGFRGSILSDHPSSSYNCVYDSAHLAQTYTALCILLILGDDFSRLDRRAILRGVSACQYVDGSFFGTGDHQSENDMRFLFCACAICYMLDDFSQIDISSMTTFIRRSICYDGGIGQGPGLESHGGSTFCAVAALALVGHLWDGTVLSECQIERLKSWAVRKQDEGFHGRTNKPDDSCYAFWMGATLAILNAQCLVNWPALRAFLLRTQDSVIGGFCKHEDSSHSDLLHTYFSLAALAMFGEPMVRPLFAPLNISARAHERLCRIWKK